MFSATPYTILVKYVLALKPDVQWSLASLKQAFLSDSRDLFLGSSGDASAIYPYGMAWHNVGISDAQ